MKPEDWIITKADNGGERGATSGGKACAKALKLKRNLTQSKNSKAVSVTEPGLDADATAGQCWVPNGLVEGSREFGLYTSRDEKNH